MSIKCKFCGNIVSDNDIYCSRCGNKLITDKKKNILLIDSFLSSNFVLTKKLSQNGFNVKSLSSTVFAFDELSKHNYDLLIVVLNLDDEANIVFLRKVRKLYKNLRIIPIIKTSEDKYLHLINELNISYVAHRPISMQSLIENINKIKVDEIKYPVHKKDDIERIIQNRSKENLPIYIINFNFDNFNKNIISDSENMLDSIYNSLKRTDIFAIIEDVGFIVIPDKDTNIKGANILMQKIHRKINENKTENLKLKNFGIFEYTENNIKPSDITKNIINNNFIKKPEIKEIAKEVKKSEKSADIENFFEPRLSEENLSQIVKNKHLIYSIISSMDDEAAARLYYDTKFKPIINPYVTISIAKHIKNLSAQAKIDTTQAKRIFEEAATDLISKSDMLKNDDILNTINSDMSLMTLPEVQSNIIFLINEEASFSRIVSEISKDPAISGKILKLVNSAFFGFQRQIKSLHKAVTILGTEEILGISLSISYINSLSKNIKLVKQLWKQTIAVLAVIKFIEKYGKINTYASTSGVLHNIGKMFLTQYHPAKYLKIIEESKERQIPYSAVELKHISTPHTQIGYKIADLWNLPDKIKNAILYHHYPYWSQATYLAVLNVSICIANELGYGIDSQGIGCTNYHSYTIMRKKHGINILDMLKQNREEIVNNIKDMMMILS